MATSKSETTMSGDMFLLVSLLKHAFSVAHTVMYWLVVRPSISANASGNTRS